jgi:hypothetical protein
MSEFRGMFGVADAQAVLAQAESPRFQNWRQQTSPALPSADELVGVVNVLLEASLLAEEGRAVRCAVAWAPRAHAGTSSHAYPLAEPLELTAKLVRRLGLATDTQRTYLLVDHPVRDGVPSVWGLYQGSGTSSFPPFLHARASGPATLSVEFFGETLWALERGRSVLRVDPMTSLLRVKRALGAAPNDQRAQCIARLVLGAQRLGHGGTVALCDSAKPGCTGGYGLDVRGPLSAQLAEQHALVQRRSLPQSCVGNGPSCPAYEQAEARTALDERSAFLAQLTNIDGALVLGAADLRVVRFGATLADLASLTTVHELDPARPSQRGEPIPLQRLGGTRHQSAARWVAAAKGERSAVVISSDGPVTLVIAAGDGVGVIRNMTF